jgi:hypothetical protein
MINKIIMSINIDNIFNLKDKRHIPIQIEIGDPELENIFSDIILFSGRIDKFNSFYRFGGPFKRTTNRGNWARNLDVSEYKWPKPDEIVGVFDLKIKEKLIKVESNKFKVLKMLGPTELAESFCADKVPEKYYLKGNIYHDFNFSYLTTTDVNKSAELHNRITEYITEIIQKSNVIDQFNAIRIADDIFDYQGYLYFNEFIHKIWRRNHIKITDSIRKRDCYSILHTDGNLIKEIEFINSIYAGVHPLDLSYKNSMQELNNWLSKILKIRDKTDLTFFTGIPINLLYGDLDKFEILIKFLPLLINKLIGRKLILSTTHRPYGSIDIRSSNIKKRYLKIRNIIKNIINKI